MQDAMATKMDALRDRSLRYVDQLEAHMDEGGLTAPNNLRDLIEMVRELCGKNGAPFSEIVDFGTDQERAAAKRVAQACDALNKAIFDANFIGVNCKVVDLAENWDSYSNLQVHRMERRVMILPTENDPPAQLRPLAYGGQK